MAATRLVLVVRPATHGTRAPLPWLQHARVANETLIRRAHKFQIHRKKKRKKEKKRRRPASLPGSCVLRPPLPKIRKIVSERRVACVFIYLFIRALLLLPSPTLLCRRKFLHGGHASAEFTVCSLTGWLTAGQSCSERNKFNRGVCRREPSFYIFMSKATPSPRSFMRLIMHSRFALKAPFSPPKKIKKIKQ